MSPVCVKDFSSVYQGKPMKLDENTLIEQLKAAACKGGAPSSAGVRRKEKPAPPVTEAEMLEAEARLGSRYLHYSGGFILRSVMAISDRDC